MPNPSIKSHPCQPTPGWLEKPLMGILHWLENNSCSLKPFGFRGNLAFWRCYCQRSKTSINNVIKTAECFTMNLWSQEVPFSSSDFESMSNKRALLTQSIAQDIPQDLGTDQTSTDVSIVCNCLTLIWLMPSNWVHLEDKNIVRSLIVSDAARWTTL